MGLNKLLSQSIWYDNFSEEDSLTCRVRYLSVSIEKKKNPKNHFDFLFSAADGPFYWSSFCPGQNLSVILIINLWPKGPLSLQHLPLFASFSLIRRSALWSRVLTIDLFSCKWWKAQHWDTGQGERIFGISSSISQTWKHTDLYLCATTGNIRPLSILSETSGKSVRRVNPSGSMNSQCKYCSNFSRYFTIHLSFCQVNINTWWWNKEQQKGKGSQYHKESSAEGSVALTLSHLCITPGFTAHGASKRVADSNPSCIKEVGSLSAPIIHQ